MMKSLKLSLPLLSHSPNPTHLRSRMVQDTKLYDVLGKFPSHFPRLAPS